MNRSQRRQAARIARKARPFGPGTERADSGADVGADLQAGLQLHEAGNLSAAAVVYRRVLASDPDNADALHLFGVVHHQTGDYTAAIDLINRAIAINGGNSNFHNNLAVSLEVLSDFEAAAAACRRALELNPDMAEAHSNLGSALMGMGQPEDAAASHRRAIALKPDFADAYSNLGAALLEMGQSEDAVTAGQKALDLNPGLATAHSNLGTALVDLGRYHEADAAYRRALEIQPALAEVFGKRAYLHERMHRLDDALAIATHGLELSPNHPVCSLVAARCERRQGHYERGIAHLTKVLHTRLADDDKQHLHFELGHLHDRAGDSDSAFDHFAAGNRLASLIGSRGADKDTYSREIDRIDARFRDDWARSWPTAPTGDCDDAPTFLIGFPRSGTTLLDQVLDSHPRLNTLDELPAIDGLVRKIGEFPGGYPVTLATLTPADIEILRTSYFASVDTALNRRSGCRLVDKLPLNIVHAGLISRIFPTARFVLAVRHPCDVCLSCFMQEFRINDAMANFFTIEDAAALYAKVMDLWQKYLAALPLNHHIVRYEDLVDDFETETRRLLEFLGVGWNDAVLGYADHARNRGKINTPSYHQVAEPIYRRARYRWQRYAERLAPVMDTLAPYIEYFGYSER